jgi:serine protease SohB
MHEIFLRYGLFLAETVTLVIAVGAVVVIIASAVRAARRGDDNGGHFEIKHLNEHLQQLADTLNDAVLTRDARRKERKQRKKRDREARKADRSVAARVFVLDFHGDIGASQVTELREEISALLQISRDGDEVVLRLESGGGTVHGYGLAASQLRRIRDRGLRLTVSVDKVAASGGYMMAAVADRILAAPFAVIGSIGVVGQLPNFSRLLKRHDVDFELHTAGAYKRTLTLFGENTDAAREKFREELEDTHELFKAFLADNRPVLKLDEVATGEHWYGTRALDLKLVDELRTSDDHLLERAREHEVFEVRYKPRRSLGERLAHGLVKLRNGTRSSLQPGPAGML